MNGDEFVLAKPDNSALLHRREMLRLVIAAFGFDAHSFEGEDEDGYFIEICKQKIRTAGELCDLAEPYKRREFE